MAGNRVSVSRGRGSMKRLHSKELLGPLYSSAKWAHDMKCYGLQGAAVSGGAGGVLGPPPPGRSSSPSPLFQPPGVP